MKLKHAAAIANETNRSTRKGHTVESADLRVKLPTKMKKMLAARI
jgi:hypothetical protein